MAHVTWWFKRSRRTLPNEAARLTEQAKSRLGRVLASEESVARSGGEGRRWGDAGALELRGRSLPTRAFEPGPAEPAPAEHASPEPDLAGGVAAEPPPAQEAAR